MKVALVYDRVNKLGGAERIITALHEIWPEAPLYTTVYDPAGGVWARGWARIQSSWLNRWPGAGRHHEWYPWLAPAAAESFDFDNYQVVISVSSAESKGVITKPFTYHLNYCLTPTWYLWGERRCEIPLMTNYLRRWDRVASQRPDEMVAISKTVRARIEKYYGRAVEVIYPPVDTDLFQIQNAKVKSDSFYLIVSRLVKYKKIDLAVKAFNKLGWPLKIVGVGREMGYLRSLAKDNIEFLGQLTDGELLGYYRECLAVVFPQEEDFGLVPLEAQACGKPVLAYRGGGATETVIEGVTGEFFNEQAVESLVASLKGFRVQGFKQEKCRQNALRFSKERFKREFKKTVEEKWRKFRS